ncbi:alpha/beta fold hydrolase [Streptomyces chartreusis]|uniref:alpha/beta fold hydrolase n=1 Tax=Streptomyces chartreusis TaxID=1969 RepID=UPI0036ADD463
MPELFDQLTPDDPDLGSIGAPTLVLAGDDDIITLEHTIALYRAIPGSQPAVVPGTSHALPMEKPAEVNRIVLDFLAHEPITTMMPVRRARPAAPADGGQT